MRDEDTAVAAQALLDLTTHQAPEQSTMHGMITTGYDIITNRWHDKSLPMIPRVLQQSINHPTAPNSFAFYLMLVADLMARIDTPELHTEVQLKTMRDQVIRYGVLIGANTELTLSPTKNRVQDDIVATKAKQNLMPLYQHLLNPAAVKPDRTNIVQAARAVLQVRAPGASGTRPGGKEQQLQGDETPTTGLRRGASGKRGANQKTPYERYSRAGLREGGGGVWSNDQILNVVAHGLLQDHGWTTLAKALTIEHGRQLTASAVRQYYTRHTPNLINNRGRMKGLQDQLRSLTGLTEAQVLERWKKSRESDRHATAPRGASGIVSNR